MKLIVKRNTLGLVVLITLACGPQNANAKDMAVLDPFKAIETHMFVLPAVDCYRKSSLNFTTDERALKNLLSTAMGKVSDSQLALIKKAAIQGATKYDKIVAAVGTQGFCARVVKQYGPNGTVIRGLMVEKRR